MFPSQLPYLKIAWRNIWKHKRRSLITIVGIAIAIVYISLTRSLEYGTYTALKSFIVNLYAGDIQYQRQQFSDSYDATYSFKADRIDPKAFSSDFPFIVAHTERLTSQGLIQSSSHTTGVLTVGIDPEKEAKVSRFSSMIKTGSPLAQVAQNEVVLGHNLAQVLEVAVGDTISILHKGKGFLQRIQKRPYAVKGTLYTGDADIDNSFALLHIKDAQRQFSANGRITQLIFKTSDLEQAGDYVKEITQNTEVDERFTFLSWQERLPQLEQLIQWDQAIGDIFILFLLFILGFEIFNTTFISIEERTKEFGILQAMGLTPSQLTILIVLESVVKIVIALLIGLGLSWIIVSIGKQHPLPLTGELKDALASWGFIADIYFSADKQIYLEPLRYIFSISLLALAFPILKMLRLPVIKALTN